MNDKKEAATRAERKQTKNKEKLYSYRVANPKTGRLAYLKS